MCSETERKRRLRASYVSIKKMLECRLDEINKRIEQIDKGDKDVQNEGI